MLQFMTTAAVTFGENRRVINLLQQQSGHVRIFYFLWTFIIQNHLGKGKDIVFSASTFYLLFVAVCSAHGVLLDAPDLVLNNL